MPQPISTNPASDALGKLGVAQEVLWNALVTEPATGVSIVTMTGKVLYINDQSAKIFLGPSATPKSAIGRNLHDMFPPKWVEERLEIFRTIIRTNKPVRLRSIWQGQQHVSWIHHVEALNEESVEPGEPSSQAVPDRFLVITRRVAGDVGRDRIVPPDHQYEALESEVVDLGPLDVLTPRELEVLALLGQGLSLKEIAGTLYRSVKTVDNHRAALGKKLAINDRIKLAEVALRAGLTLKDAERKRV